MAEDKQFGINEAFSTPRFCDIEMSCGVFQILVCSRQCNFVDTDFVLRRVIGLRFMKWPGIMLCNDAC
jgi:hypothetical protein